MDRGIGTSPRVTAAAEDVPGRGERSVGLLAEQSVQVVGRGGGREERRAWP